MHDPVPPDFAGSDSVPKRADSLGWRPTNLVHSRGSNSVSEQLGAEWAINTLIHVVQELCVLVVFTWENTSVKKCHKYRADGE